ADRYLRGSPTAAVLQPQAALSRRAAGAARDAICLWHLRQPSLSDALERSRRNGALFSSVPDHEGHWPWGSVPDGCCAALLSGRRRRHPQRQRRLLHALLPAPDEERLRTGAHLLLGDAAPRAD